MKTNTHIYRLLLIVMFICSIAGVAAQKPRAYILGGKGTNYSDRKLDHNGLRTGVYADIHHLYGFYADGSFATFHSTLPNVSLLPGGYGLSGGFCYEAQLYYFKLQTGIGIRFQNVRNNVADTVFYDNYVVDARVYPYTLKYEFRHRTDSAWNLHAQIPFLMGAGVSNFYFLSGFKFNYTLNYGKTFVNAVGETSATYPQYLGHFVEMDNHGLRKGVPIEREGDRLRLRFDVQLSLEVGAEWGRILHHRSRYKPVNKGVEQYESRFRVALFADYSIFNIMPRTEERMLYIPGSYKWDFPEYEFHHVFTTQGGLDSQLRNLYAGIKLTVLFGTFFNYDCRLCGPWESERDMANPKVERKRYRTDGNGNGK